MRTFATDVLATLPDDGHQFNLIVDKGSGFADENGGVGPIDRRDRLGEPHLMLGRGHIAFRNVVSVVEANRDEIAHTRHA